MKIIQIRQGVFETNSSSTHSITICSKEEWESFKIGEMLLDCNNKLIPVTEKAKNDENNLNHNAWEVTELELFTKEYTTKGGEEIVAFGKYGQDG